LQSLIGACVAHVQSNVPGALLKLDEEYLHQVRVGLRRCAWCLPSRNIFMPMPN